MRNYPIDSAQAAGRLLALSMVVDGNLAHSELTALSRSRILQYIDLEQDAFQQLLQELCDDLLTSATYGMVQVERTAIDAMLGEIVQPDLRRRLLQAMWNIADADGWLADGEAVLLGRASSLWSAESNFIDRPVRLS
ncbi:TerB family tellurite resistance protein [Massilia sp. CF038]|uniref:tellurite resistance TerB family protein n=1 Tax=Massilia sp. CF038 TaxID=1881045 RepID=UPI000913AF1A|nr:TerB family tellurite resistance protein [Massilia sp. CF038]SHH67083.1 Uncharacterized conserved protein, tellurite resistance protein B (TerB) family [Massilia sp. CF038]